MTTHAETAQFLAEQSEFANTREAFWLIRVYGTANAAYSIASQIRRGKGKTGQKYRPVGKFEAKVSKVTTPADGFAVWARYTGN